MPLDAVEMLKIAEVKKKLRNIRQKLGGFHGYYSALCTVSIYVTVYVTELKPHEKCSLCLYNTMVFGQEALCTQILAKNLDSIQTNM